MAVDAAEGGACQIVEMTAAAAAAAAVVDVAVAFPSD